MAYSKNSDGTYTDLTYTDFPATCDSWVDSQDVTAAMVDVANTYRRSIDSGDMATANNLLSMYPTLKNMMINAATINKIKHAVMAVERLFSEDIEEYITSYTDAASSSASAAASSATSAANSASSAKSAETTALELVEDLKSLTGTLPEDFTEYIEALSEIRTYMEWTDHTLNASGWVANSDTSNSGTYPKCYYLSVADATSNDSADVVFYSSSQPVVAAAGICPTHYVGDATVTFYAMQTPTADIQLKLCLVNTAG